MIEAVKQADVVIITAGAGMGVDSGLPDFRGNEGMWKAYPSLGKKKISFSTIANPTAFKQNPELAWAFYGHRFDLYKNTKPHDGYKALLELVKEKKDHFVVTSNVDGAFQKAGFSEDKVYEIHGRINHFQCMNDCCDPWKVDENTSFNVNPNTLDLDDDLPKCPKCGGMARPNIMMFGDFGYDSQLTDIQEKAFNTFMNKYDKDGTKIVILEFGAGTAIPSIRHMGEYISENIPSATLVRVNPRESQGPKGTVSIAKGAVAAVAEDLVPDNIKKMFFMD